LMFPAPADYAPSPETSTAGRSGLPAVARLP
jgi:hypothetical protein